MTFNRYRAGDCIALILFALGAIDPARADIVYVPNYYSNTILTYNSAGVASTFANTGAQRANRPCVRRQRQSLRGELWEQHDREIHRWRGLAVR